MLLCGHDLHLGLGLLQGEHFFYCDFVLFRLAGLVRVLGLGASAARVQALLKM